MRRRDFITLLGGAAAWPIAAQAQQGERVRRIAVLMTIARDAEFDARVGALREGLRSLGWIEGRNIQIEYRYAGGEPDRIQTYAAELVGMRPEIIFSSGAPGLVALHKETRQIPIVFVFVSRPGWNGSS